KQRYKLVLFFSDILYPWIQPIAEKKIQEVPKNFFSCYYSLKMQYNYYSHGIYIVLGIISKHSHTLLHTWLYRSISFNRPKA
uniref:Uncharacterized protein n=1 Tax=Paramormyrops kingsleyae TaxID=1676925 RepID=A0A3B3R2I4_9TELE